MSLVWQWQTSLEAAALLATIGWFIQRWWLEITFEGAAPIWA